MDSAGQVILVLQLVLTVGPLAVYFLGLGLVSSQARPCLVSERSDFVLLAIAFVPLICWPLVSLITSGSFVFAVVLFAAIGLLFFMLLPGGGQGWVVYNISAQECRRTLRRACSRLGWEMEFARPSGDESQVVIRPAGLTVGLSGLPWLRNMTVRFQPGAGCSADRRLLIEAFSRELEGESMLPSPTGAGLVVIGATLLGLPMWYLFSNMNAIVDVVRRIMPA